MKRLLFLVILIAILLIPIGATITSTDTTVGIDRANAAFFSDEAIELWNNFCDSIGIELPGCDGCGYC